MDPAAIALSVASLLAKKAAEAAADEAGKGAWAAIGRIGDTLRHRFGGDPQITDSLKQLESSPTGQGRKTMLAEVLEARLASDPQLADELARLVEQAMAQVRDVHIHLPAQSAAPTPPAAPSPLTQISSRFMQVYEWHGIHPGEIPDFLQQTGGPRVSLNDLSSEERLLERLDGALLDFTTETFALGRDWLRQGGATKVLTSLDFYKHVEGLADFLLVQSVSRSGRTDLWALSSYVGGTMFFFTEELSLLRHFGTVGPPVEDFESQDIYMGAIYEVPIMKFRGRTIYCYYALKALPWNYWRSHYQLMAMMAVADACGVVVTGRYLSSRDDVISLCNGNRFPVELTTGFSPPDWWPQHPYLDENPRSTQESYQRKWSRYLAYFEEQGYRETVRAAKESREKTWFGNVEQVSDPHLVDP
jgi:hypothetical protein